jgi:hypothetical protein
MSQKNRDTTRVKKKRETKGDKKPYKKGEKEKTLSKKK